jgi:hypothetical protein
MVSRGRGRCRLPPILIMVYAGERGGVLRIARARAASAEGGGSRDGRGLLTVCILSRLAVARTLLSTLGMLCHPLRRCQIALTSLFGASHLRSLRLARASCMWGLFVAGGFTSLSFFCAIANTIFGACGSAYHSVRYTPITSGSSEGSRGSGVRR